jgi:hypothetical protein
MPALIKPCLEMAVEEDRRSLSPNQALEETVGMSLLHLLHFLSPLTL